MQRILRLSEKASQLPEYYLSDVSLEQFAKTQADDAIIKKKVVPGIQGNLL